MVAVGIFLFHMTSMTLLLVFGVWTIFMVGPDRCLPQFLLKETRRGTSYHIIIASFILSVSVLIITQGDLKSLVAIYTLSFLSVIALFAIGNLLLKIKRADLPRPDRASYLTVLLALFAVLVAIWGNARLNSAYLVVFFEYLALSILVVKLMLMREQLVKQVVFFLDETRQRLRRETQEAIEQYETSEAEKLVKTRVCVNVVERYFHQLLREIRAQQLVFFTRGDHLQNLNQVMLYIRENEQTDRVRFVHVYQNKDDIPEQFDGHLEFLDKVYPEIDIEFVTVEGEFGPDLISKLSKDWGIPTNLMFIGSPTGQLSHHISELGGVRLII